MGILSRLIGNAGEADINELKDKFNKLLIDDEEIQIGYKLVRDMFLFTDKRMIIIDKQGLTGKKQEYLSIAYKSISRFSIESAGTFDLDAELKIWVSGEHIPCVQKSFNRKSNIYEIQQVLAAYVLN